MLIGALFSVPPAGIVDRVVAIVSPFSRPEGV
jgi:hypothetical protein